MEHKTETNQNRIIPELLAPAGDMDCLHAAINAGADAVYLAGEKFGARAYAKNFSTEQLVSALDLCHAHGIRIYLTLNTLIKEKELPEVVPYLEPLVEAGLDGIILQDLGVFRLVRNAFPGLPLHISTQMSVSSSYGKELLLKEGAVRIVPARECMLNEVRSLVGDGTEIESFIHGAMCYCYSGQCLMSSMIGGRSGNRGRCAQPCRLPYAVDNKEPSYLLSLKDMNTLHILPELIDAGIASFKIEGRMKAPEYVAGVTSIYRKYIDLYLNIGRDAASFRIDPADENLLAGLYVRSQTGDGYYHRHSGKDMITVNSPAYTETSAEIRERLRSRYVKEPDKIPIDIRIACLIGKPLTMVGNVGALTASVVGSVVEEAKNAGVTTEDLKKKGAAFGNSPFILRDFHADLDGSAYANPSELKNLRRRLVKMLCDGITPRQEITPSGSPETPLFSKIKGSVPDKNEVRITVLVSAKEQLFAALSRKEHISRIFLEHELLENKDAKDVILALSEAGKETDPEAGFKVVIVLPRILRERDAERLNDLAEQYRKIRDLHNEIRLDGFLCGSADALGWCVHHDLPAYGDHSLYQWNSESLFLTGRYLSGFTYPLELQSSEIRDLCRSLQDADPTGNLVRAGEYVIYGRAPLMFTANCIRQTTGNCRKQDGSYYSGIASVFTDLTDRKGSSFPVKSDCRYCTNTIYNGLPTSLITEIPYLFEDGIRSFRIDLTTETEKECETVLNKVIDALKHPEEKTEKMNVPTTKGHFRRGVE